MTQVYALGPILAESTDREKRRKKTGRLAICDGLAEV